MAVLTICTNPGAISRIEASKTIPLTKDLQTNQPFVFTTGDHQRRVELYSKTLKEKAVISTVKAAHNRMSKGKINPPAVSRSLSEQLIQYYTSSLGFNLTKFNGIPLVS